MMSSQLFVGPVDLELSCIVSNVFVCSISLSRVCKLVSLSLSLFWVVVRVWVSSFLCILRLSGSDRIFCIGV